MTPVVSPPISAIAIRVASPFDKHRRPRDDGRRDEQDLRSPAAGRCRTTVGETVRHTEAVGYAAGEGHTAHARAPVAAESDASVRTRARAGRAEEHTSEP